MRSRGSINRPRFVEVPIQPHLLFFWAYNFIYLVPLVGIYFYGYVDTGAIGQIGLDSQSLRAIWLVYAEGLAAFSLGSIFVSLVLSHLHTFNVGAEQRIPDIGITEKLGILLIAAAFIAAKAALVPLGVYHQYAFTDIEFKNSIWSFSMVCSEFVLLTATLLLFSDARRNLLGFAILSLLNCVNLLHGTRIIFVVNLLVLVMYAYMRGLLSLRRVILFGPPAFVAVLLLAYTVFMSRSGVTNDGLNAANTVSPLVYESLFSQISLRNVVNSSDIVNSTGSFSNFVSDVVLGVMPRVIVPDKDTLQYLARFFDTSEINTSFYGPIKAQLAKLWCRKVAEVNPRFLFTAKLYRAFTHSPVAVVGPTSAATIRPTDEDEARTREGLDVLAGEGRLGALLIQFPLSFKNTSLNREYLERLLHQFIEYPRVVEVRDSSWDNAETLAAFAHQNVGFCNIDQPVLGRSLAPTEHVTAAIAYIRLHGRNYDQWFDFDNRNDRYNYLYNEKELVGWKERIENVAERAETTYVITNNHFESKAGVNALELKAMITGKRVSAPPTLVRKYPELSRFADPDENSENEGPQFPLLA